MAEMLSDLESESIDVLREACMTSIGSIAAGSSPGAIQAGVLRLGDRRRFLPSDGHLRITWTPLKTTSRTPRES